MGDPAILGPYRLVQKVAAGRSTELWLAALHGEAGFEKHVIVKRLQPHLETDGARAAKFVDAMRASARLVHPHIVQTLELGIAGNEFFAALEYVDGADLAALSREKAEPVWEAPVAAWIGRSVLDALDHAHQAGQALAHGALCASKVLVSTRGDVKLVGFGRGSGGEASAVDDLFAVGILLAELLTGRRLFADANDHDVLLLKLARLDRWLADVDPELGDIVRKAVEPRAAHRWPTAAAFRDAIDEWMFARHHRITSQHIAVATAGLFGGARSRRKRLAELELVGRAPTRDDERPPIAMPPSEPRERVHSLHIPPVAAGPAAAPPPARTHTASRPPPERTTTPQPAQVIPDDRPPRQSTRGMLHPSRARAATPPAEPEAPPARGSSPLVEVAPAVSRTATPISFDDLLDNAAWKAAPPPSRRDPAVEAALAKLGAPDDAGELAATPPARVLCRLIAARASGVLVLAIDAMMKQIALRDGAPVAITSNLGREQLGDDLVDKNVISDGELAMAMAVRRDHGDDVGAALVALGLLQASEVQGHASRILTRAFADACTWRKGHYAWFAGREGPRSTAELDGDPLAVLAAAALESGDERWLASGAKLRAVVPAPVDPERFAIDGLVALLASLDGTRTVEDLARRAGDAAEQQRTRRLLCLLDACELARE